MMQEGYDTMQVCLNGHQVTDMATSFPQHRKPFCPDCGEQTITACPECGAEIQGFYHVPGVFTVSGAAVANNCPQCGTAYPWRQAAIASAMEVLQMDLDGQDAVDAAALVEAIAVDTPRTEVAALKLRRLLPKVGKAAYDVAVKVVSDVASETAKKTLGMKP